MSRVKELRDRTDLTELNDREVVAQVKETAGVDCRACRTLFCRTVNGEYVEVWGTRSTRPQDSDEVHEHTLDPTDCAPDPDEEAHYAEQAEDQDREDLLAEGYDPLEVEEELARRREESEHHREGSN